MRRRPVGAELDAGRLLPAEVAIEHVDPLEQGAEGDQDHHGGEHPHHAVVFQHVARPPLRVRNASSTISPMKPRCCISVRKWLIKQPMKRLAPGA